MQGGVETIAFAVVVSIIAVVALGLALEGWLKGEIGWPARALIGAAALLLLWLEPTVTLIGLAVLAAGLALHFVTRRPPDEPSGGERFTRGAPQAASSSPSSSS